MEWTATAPELIEHASQGGPWASHSPNYIIDGPAAAGDEALAPCQGNPFGGGTASLDAVAHRARPRRSRRAQRRFLATDGRDRGRLHLLSVRFASNMVMMLADTSEADLVVAATAGDSASFGELVRRHAPRLVRLARQLVGPDGAEDMVQEAMIDAWKGLRSFAGRAALATWLHRITLNRCLGELRRRKPVVVEVEPLELLARWEDADYSVDPVVVALRRSQTETLRSVLDELPEGYRTALILHDGQGLTASELAEMQGIPLGTAKSNIRRGRMALVSLLGDDGRDLVETRR